MTTVTLTEIDLDGVLEELPRGGWVQYIGKARQQSDGTWRCLANVEGCLCIVQVKVYPVHDTKEQGTA